MLQPVEHTFQDAVEKARDGNPLAVDKLVSVGVQINGITTATITFEGTIDNTNWVAVLAANLNNGSTGTTATADGLYLVDVTALEQLRCRISSYTAGTITVKGLGSRQGGASFADIDVDADVSDRIDRLVGKITNYDVLANGTLGALNETVELTCAGLSTVGVGISGAAWAGTIVAETTTGDGVWDVIPLVDNTMGSAGLSTTVNGNFLVGVAGALTLRLRMSVYTSGTATVYLEGTSAPAGVFLGRSIPTGVNSIGTIGLNAGTNNIGDVDVLTLPGAVQGPGSPTIDSYSTAAVDLAASTADQVLVAAPGASKQIWVYGLFMMADTAAGTVTLQDESDTALSGTMAVSDEGGWVLPLSGNFAMPWIKVATNKALEADTGACTVDGIICYAIVSV